MASRVSVPGHYIIRGFFNLFLTALKIHLLLSQSFMKKILLFSSCVLLSLSLFAQEDPKPAKKKEVISLANRNGDHFMVQLGLTSLAGKPDTIVTGGLSKSINVYLMMDYPFKTNPHMSMAFGPGIASDQIAFDKTNVGIKDLTTTLRFTDVSDTNHFKKTKLATVWLEAPIEFRYSKDPLGKGFKFAVGVKVGTLLNAHVKNKDLVNRSNSSINSYVVKEYSKKFFNSNRLSAQARVGYGHFTIFANYSLTPLLKDGKGPVMRPFSVGLTLSGI